jgi:hypothetical protein
MFDVLMFYLLRVTEESLSELMGVEFNGVWFEVMRVRMGVDVFDSSGVESILFLSERGPCMSDES